MTEEMQMTMNAKELEHRTTLAATKAERSRDKEEAMREYEAEKRAQLVNTARLRALRLAREAADTAAAEIQKPKPAKKKAVGRVSTPKPAGSLPRKSRRKAPAARSGDEEPSAPSFSAADDADLKAAE